MTETPELLPDDNQLFELATAAWESQTSNPWYTDAIVAVIDAVRAALTRVPPSTVGVDTIPSVPPASSFGELAAEQVSSYVESYRFEIDGGESYAPNERERSLIEDALFGYLADVIERAPPPSTTDAWSDAIEALRECASRCRYDGDLFHDQGNWERRDASWWAASLAEAALTLRRKITPLGKIASPPPVSGEVELPNAGMHSGSVTVRDSGASE